MVRRYVVVGIWCIVGSVLIWAAERPDVQDRTQRGFSEVAQIGSKRREWTHDDWKLFRKNLYNLALPIFKNVLTFLLGVDGAVSLAFDPQLLPYYKRKNGFMVENGGRVVSSYGDHLYAWYPHRGLWQTHNIDTGWQFHSIERGSILLTHASEKRLRALDAHTFKLQAEYVVDHKRSYFQITGQGGKLFVALHPLLLKGPMKTVFIYYKPAEDGRAAVSKRLTSIPKGGIMPPITLRDDGLLAAHAVERDEVYLIDTTSDKLLSTLSLSDRVIGEESPSAGWKMEHPETHKITFFGMELQGNQVVATTADAPPPVRDGLPTSRDFCDPDHSVSPLFFTQVSFVSENGERDTIPCMVSLVAALEQRENAEDGIPRRHCREKRNTITYWDLRGKELYACSVPALFSTIPYAVNDYGKSLVCAHPVCCYTLMPGQERLRKIVVDHESEAYHSDKIARISNGVMSCPSGAWGCYYSVSVATEKAYEAGHWKVRPPYLLYLGLLQLDRHLVKERPQKVRERALYFYMLHCATELGEYSKAPKGLLEAVGARRRPLGERVVGWWRGEKSVEEGKEEVVE